MSQHCDRCHGKACISIMSRFNTDRLCMACEKAERRHPHYQVAAKKEREEVSRGNYNYQGIGKPDDL